MIDLVPALEAGLQGLNTGDGLAVPDALNSERARNIAQALVGAFGLAANPLVESKSSRVPSARSRS